MVYQLRAWQQEAVDFLFDTLVVQDKGHVYLNAPTATGKSLAIFAGGENLPIDGTRVVIVGTSQIVKQHRESFQKYGCMSIGSDVDCALFLSPKGHKILITTWQGLAQQAKNEKTDYNHLLPIAVLFFDECHLGGSHYENTSYQNIIDYYQPTKRVNVSATIQIANEKLLGVKKGHTYRYKLSDAYEDGLLNDVHMCEVHTGTRAKYTLRQIEDTVGENFEEISERNLSDLSSKFAEMQVDVMEAVKRIVQHRHDSMISIYFAEHSGESAIFYCPNIEAAEEATSRFNAEARRLGKVGVRAQAVHTKEPNHDVFIEQFRNKELSVVFVVGMLQEGFDMPSLRLVFDCRFYRKWDTARLSRLIQKIGRVMRKDEGKGISLYYYARDIHDFYRSKHKTETPDMPDVSDADDSSTSNENPGEQIGEAANLAVAKLIAEADELLYEKKSYEVDIVVPETKIKSIKVEPVGGEIPSNFSTKRITIAATSLYVLKDVRDYQKVRVVPFSEYFGNSADIYKRELLTLPTGSAKPPFDSKLGEALSRYTKSGSSSYDSRLTRILKNRHPDWDIGERNRLQENKRILYSLPVGIEKPIKSTKLGTALRNYTTASSKLFDPELTRTLKEKHPDWWINATNANKKALYNLPVDSERPIKRTKLGQALRNYTTPSYGCYDPEFTRQIKERFPHWKIGERKGNSKSEAI